MNDTGSKVSDSIAEDLAAQIVGEVTTAEREWEKIDQNLARWFSGEAILGAGLGVLAGSVGWIPASTVAIAGSINLAISMTKRRKFIKYYPAGSLSKQYASMSLVRTLLAVFSDLESAFGDFLCLMPNALLSSGRCFLPESTSRKCSSFIPSAGVDCYADTCRVLAVLEDPVRLNLTTIEYCC